MAHCRPAREGKWGAGVAPGQSVDMYTYWHTIGYWHDTSSYKGDMMQIDYHFHFDHRGHTAETSESDHIRDLIEQILFTSPGERVNRPNFGCGLQRLIFAPNSDALTATTQFLVQGALQQEMGDLIGVEAVEVQNDDSQLSIVVQYTVRLTQQRRVDQFVRGA
jgi:uncharacterized protein